MRIGPIEIIWKGFKRGPEELNAAERGMLRKDRYIDAIKSYRNRTMSTLQESKEIVDWYRQGLK